MPKQKKKKAQRVNVRTASPYMINNAPFGSNVTPPIISNLPILPGQPVIQNVPLSSLAVTGGLEGQMDYLRDLRARTMSEADAKCAENVENCSLEQRQKYEFSFDPRTGKRTFDTGGMGDPCTTDPRLIGQPQCQGKTVIWYDPVEKKSKIVKEKPCDPTKEDCSDRITNFDSVEKWKERQAKCQAAETTACLARGMSAAQCATDKDLKCSGMERFTN